MRKVDLRMNELRNYNIIKRVAHNEITVNRAQVLLNCTKRTIYNLIKRYNMLGKESFIHGNRGRSPSTIISQDLKENILELYKDKYYLANFRHFMELLEENENIKISYNALYTLLYSAGFISPKCHHVTRRNKNKTLKLKLEENINLSESEKDYIAVTNLQDPSVAHPRKPRAKYQGELIQMDASEHAWFGPSHGKQHLHLALDDASGQIIGAYFAPQETLKGYYNVLYQILTVKGIPAKFLTDNRTVFEYGKLKNPSDEKDTFTQFGYACHQLGIDLETTSIPQAKGRVERMFGTLQSRLITELNIAGITTIQEANCFLKTFITRFNNVFAVQDDYTKSVYDNQLTPEKINYTLAIISKRKVDNGNAIKYKKQYYQFYNDDNLMLIQPKTECFVLEAFDGSLVASIGEVFYNLVELERNERFSKNFDSQPKSKPKYKGHKPKQCHPWTYYTFKEKWSKIQPDFLY